MTSRRKETAFALLGVACWFVLSCGPATSSSVTPSLVGSSSASSASVQNSASDAAPVLGESASPITFARMAKYPEPGWQVPRLIRFSPDGKLVTFVESESGSEEMALFALDLSTGKIARMLRAADLTAEKKPSLDEELRRERERKRITGITDYAWAKKANLMVLPAGGDVFVRKADGAIQRVTDTPADDEIDPQICADGSHVAYVRKGELYSYDLGSKKETVLTKAKPGVTSGLSDFNGQEEFDEASGFMWSPDCKTIAYWQVDESKVKEVPVMGFRDAGASLMMQRYPLAGGPNPIVELRLVDIGSKRSTAITIGDQAARYMGRLRFTDDGESLYLQALKREQTELELWRVDVKSGRGEVIHSAKPSGWAEMTDLTLARGQKDVVMLSESGGHTHLEDIDGKSGKHLGWLTSGDWDVIDLVRYDEASDTAYVTATKDEPIGRQLYAVSLKGGEPRRITEARGTHDVTVSDKAQAFVDIASAADTPPRAEVRSLAGKPIAGIPVPSDPDMSKLGIRAPHTFTVDVMGGPKLYGALLKPRVVDPSKRYPLVVMVYGGPFVQTVTDRWSPRLIWQELADRGFFVMEVDNRGSGGRGPAFAAPIRHQMGKVELADQLAALDQILKTEPIDPKRVGIYGHSYGGFMAALAMLAAPGRFAAGIAGSPVTDFRLYDSGYTERYMGDPGLDKAGYEGTDLTKLVPNLQGNLFIIHALMDENVHFENAAKLIDALIRAQKHFDLLVFPGERHGYRNPSAKEYALRRVVDYLVEKLAPQDAR